MRILQWNANGLRGKHSSLRLLLREQNIDVALICETHLRTKMKLRFPGYFIYRRDEISDLHYSYRGLMILVRRNIIHQLLPDLQLQAMQALGVEIPIEGIPHHIYAIYRPPQNRLAPTDVRTIMDSPYPTIAAGDWNCKSPAWNSSTTCPNGRILLAEMEARDLDVTAPQVPTHFPPQASYTPDVLDFAVHKGISGQTAMEVLEDDMKSDHQPVVTTLHARPIKTAPPMPRTRVDWQRFKRIVEETTTSYPLTSPEDVNNFSDELSRTIRKAMDDSSETIPPDKSIQLPHDLRQLITKKREMRRRFLVSRCPTLKRALNALAEKISRALDDLEGEAWQERIDRAEDDLNSLHRLCRTVTATPTPTRPLLHEDGQVRYRAADRAEIFAEHLRIQFTPNPSSNAQHQIAVEQHIEDYFAEPIANEEDPVFFSPGEVQLTIKKAKPRKAPGADGITNKALRHLPKRTVAALTRLFNAIMRTGRFPETWKMGHVIMLPKPGKNPLKPGSYRPITLLSAISKVFEKLLLQHLVPHIEARPEQFGFRSEHSTTLQLSRVLHYITTALNKKESVAAVFLDMEKAFDRVWHTGLLYKLSLSPAPRRIVKVIASFLDERKIRVRVEDALSSEKPVAAGVPQGSCLSPVLYSWYTDDIPAPPNTTLALYADDAAYISTSLSKQSQNARDRLQTALDSLPEWLDRWRLAVNVQKTQAILFGEKRKMPTRLVLNGEEIAWVDKAKYLGVVIDRRLSMREHVRAVAGQVRAATAALMPVFKSRLPLRAKVGVYKTYLRSKLTYAAPAWFALASKASKATLRARQSVAIRRLAGAPRYVRNSTLARDLKIESVDDFVARLADRMFGAADASRHSHIRGIAPYHTRPPDGRAFPRDLVTRPTD